MLAERKLVKNLNEKKSLENHKRKINVISRPFFSYVLMLGILKIFSHISKINEDWIINILVKSEYKTNF